MPSPDSDEPMSGLKTLPRNQCGVDPESAGLLFAFSLSFLMPDIM